MKGMQRYKCRACKYNFTLEHKKRGKPDQLKKRALHLYLEGLGFRAIARILNVSNVSILRWIRVYGEKLKEIKCSEKPQVVEVIELDEMWHYAKIKLNRSGFGLLTIELEGGQSPSSVVIVKNPPCPQGNRIKSLE